MTMLGRGKRSAPDKDKNADANKSDKSDKADKAAKAEEAAEAARLAEEAAAKAREAARVAQIAAEEAEDEDDDETEDDAVKSLQKPGKPEDASEVTSEGDNASEGDSETSEATSVASDEAEDEEDEPEKPRKRSIDLTKATRSRAGGLTTVIAVLVVLTLALGAGATALFLKVREQHATETASKEASFAASRAAQKLSSYDYQTLDADLKAASATTTGKLHNDYEKLAAELRTVAAQQQAVSTTTILKVGVTTASPDKVTALVYANRSSATKADKQQRLPEPLRIKLTMVKKDGKWLASELTVIS